MPTKTQLIDTFLGVLHGEIGVRESGNNSGARVREYQAETTLGGSHWPWCSALLCFALKKTERQHGVDIPWSFSASCDVLWADGKARGILRPTPQRGDIGLVRAKRGGGYSNGDAIHTFAVSGVAGGRVETIEGNSNQHGGREGVGVFAHSRPVSERLVWVRWIDGVTLQDEPKPLAWTVRVEGHALKPVLDSGTNYLASGEFAAAAGVAAFWNAEDNEVVLDGRAVGTQPRLVGGKSYFSVRVLAEHMEMKIAVDSKLRVVTLS